MRTPSTPVARSRATILAALVACTLLSWPASAAPVVQWRELRVPRRVLHTMVRDSRRDRTLLFGGDGDFEDQRPSYPGVWRLVHAPVPHWEPLAVDGDGPLPRSGMCAVYDSLRDRVLVFGGSNTSGITSDLWELSLAGTPTWTLLDASAGVTPAARYSASLVLDAQDRLVLYGGDGLAANDSLVYVLPLGVAPLAWQGLALAGPGPRARHGAVYSRSTHRMTVFGGDVFMFSGNIYTNVLRPAATWELVLDDPIHWVKRASAPADTVPLPETGGALVANDAGTLAWLVPGDQGYIPSPSSPDATVWQLDLVSSTWSRLQNGAGGPGMRTGMAATFEPTSGQVLLHGGQYAYGITGTFDGTGETWRLQPGDPTPWGDAAPTPEAIYSTRMLFDAATRTLITFDPRGVWTCDLGTEAAWRLDPEGAVNAPPYLDPVSVIDPVRRRLLVFGGSAIACCGYVPATQLWSWPLDGPGAWSTIGIQGAPPPAIRGIQRAYDPIRDRVVVAAKFDTVAALELSGGTPRWTRLATVGSLPGPRFDAAVALDAARDRLVLSGGGVDSYMLETYHDLWTLDLAGTPLWTLRFQAQTGDYLGITLNQGLVADPILDRLLLLGGYGDGLRNTLYSTPLATLPAWTDFDPDGVSPMWGAGAGFYDAAAARALFWNGTLWEITWPGSASTPPATLPKQGLALAPPRPNPAPGDVTLELASDRDVAVKIEIFDTSGRRVAPIVRRQAHAGRESFPLSLSRRLAPGLYLVRASDGSRTSQVRLAVTR